MLLGLHRPLGGAKDEVVTRVSEDGPAEFADLERIRRILKRLLHLTAAKFTEVATLAGRAAVRFLGGQGCKIHLAARQTCVKVLHGDR